MSASAPDGGAPVGVARASTRLFLAQVVGNAGFFAAVLVLARGLGPADRGTVAFVIVSAMVLGRLSTLGLEQMTLVFAAQDPSIRRALLANLVAVVALAGAVIGAAAVGSLMLLDVRPADVGSEELLLVAAATPAIGLIAAGEAFMLGCSRFNAQALIGLTFPWVYAVALASVWLVSGLGVFSAAATWTAAHAAWAAAYVAVNARTAGVGGLDLSLLRRGVAFGARAWAGTTSRFLNFRVDQILFGFLGTEAALGTYAVAVNASETLLYLPGAASAALLPIVSRSSTASRADRVLRTSRAVLLLTAAATAVSAVTGPFLIPIVFGSAFEGSVVPFLLLIPGALGYVAFAIFTSALLASASPGTSSMAPVLSITVGSALNLLLIPRFGAVGAAAAATAAYTAGGITAAALYRRRHRFPARELVPRTADVQMLAGLARGFARSVRRKSRVRRDN